MDTFVELSIIIGIAAIISAIIKNLIKVCLIYPYLSAPTYRSLENTSPRTQGKFREIPLFGQDQAFYSLLCHTRNT